MTKYRYYVCNRDNMSSYANSMPSLVTDISMITKISVAEDKATFRLEYKNETGTVKSFIDMRMKNVVPDNKIYIFFNALQFYFETGYIIHSGAGIFLMTPYLVDNSCYAKEDLAKLIDSGGIGFDTKFVIAVKKKRIDSNSTLN